MVSVDHSIVPTPIPSLGVPSLGVPSLGVPSSDVPSIAPITTGDINGVVEETSVSTTSATKSIVSESCSGSSSTSTSTSTTTTVSSVIIEKSSEFSSPYQFVECDLYKSYNGLQIIKNLDNLTVIIHF